jgi:hypothetical protein
MEETSKKTGTTPLVETASLGGGKIYGVMTVSTILVKYRDGREGKDEVRLAVVVPGGEVYFFTNGALDHRPAQQWVKDGIIKYLKNSLPKTVESSPTIDITEDKTSQV